MAFGSIDLTSSAEIAKGMQVFTSLRAEFGVAEVLIHHSRKNPDGESWEDSARGSGDIFAAADSLIGMAKKAPGVIAVRAIARAARETEPFSASLDEETLTFQNSAAAPGRRLCRPSSNRGTAAHPLRRGSSSRRSRS